MADCKNPRGFSMIAHCKALGKIPRTGKKNKGKYVVSPKYKKSRRSGARKTSRRSRRVKSRRSRA